MSGPKEASRAVRVGTEYGDVVLDQRSGKYWHLNHSAALALDLFERGHDHDHIVATFADTFGLDHATASRDLSAVNRRLVEIGLLR